MPHRSSQRWGILTLSLWILAGIYCVACAGNLISLTYVDRIPRHILISVSIIVACAAIISLRLLSLLNMLAQITPQPRCCCGFHLPVPFRLQPVSWRDQLMPCWWDILNASSKGMALAVAGFCIINILWLEMQPTAVRHTWSSCACLACGCCCLLHIPQCVTQAT